MVLLLVSIKQVIERHFLRCKFYIRFHVFYFKTTSFFCLQCKVRGNGVFFPKYIGKASVYFTKFNMLTIKMRYSGGIAIGVISKHPIFNIQLSHFYYPAAFIPVQCGIKRGWSDSD